MTKTSASNEKAEYCPDVFLNPQGSGQWLQFFDLYCHKPYEEGVDAGIKGVFDSTGDVDHINAASNNDREQRLGLAYLRQAE